MCSLIVDQILPKELWCALLHKLFILSLANFFGKAGGEYEQQWNLYEYLFLISDP